MPITHAFVNGKADGADATVTRPSDWNAAHTVTGFLPGSVGSVFPGSPATGDLFWRTDLGLQAYWDGTRWLTTQLFSMTFPTKGNLDGSSSGAGINVGRMPIPYGGTWALYIVGFEWLVVTPATPYSATVYWTAKLNWADLGDSDTQLGTTLDCKTATVGASNYNFRDLAIATVLSTNAREFKLRLDPVNSAGAIIYTAGIVHYRMILT